MHLLYQIWTPSARLRVCKILCGKRCKSLCESLCGSMTVFSTLVYTFNDDNRIYAEPGGYEKINEALNHLTKALKADGVQYKTIHIKLDGKLWNPTRIGDKKVQEECVFVVTGDTSGDKIQTACSLICSLAMMVLAINYTSNKTRQSMSQHIVWSIWAMICLLTVQLALNT